eukprot:576102-Amphidinium_carterae.1
MASVRQKIQQSFAGEKNQRCSARSCRKAVLALSVCAGARCLRAARPAMMTAAVLQTAVPVARRKVASGQPTKLESAFSLHSGIRTLS